MYATELWSMSEEDFLKWLNSESTETEQQWTSCSERLPENKMKRLIDVDRFLRTLNNAAHVSGLETMSKIAETMAFMIEAQWVLFPEKIKESEWIPVSERLPEEDTRYLVTTSGTNNDIIDIAYYTEGIWHKASRIKAWMPLPEPYKEE